MSAYRALEDELAREATQIVKRQTNRVYTSVLTTTEVAAHLGVDESTTLEALTASLDVGYLSRKSVGSHYVWWSA